MALSSRLAWIYFCGMVSKVMHFEVPIDDPDRASHFYNAVFGWTVTKWGPADYWTLSALAPPGPGAEGALVPRSEAPDGVRVYIGVPDIDVAISRISAEGGEPTSGKVAIPGVGWIAHFRDSEGNHLGVLEEAAETGLTMEAEREVE